MHIKKMKKMRAACSFIIMAILTCLLSVFPYSNYANTQLFTYNAYAVDSSKDGNKNPNHSLNNIVATDSITDTENLLGDSISKVSDAIIQTKKQTGVSVRLLYISTFGNSQDPSKWASDVLISTNPAPNTLLLAVASHDGRLVVAVSPNSDEWLKRKTTVDTISDAASNALMNDSGPDWSGSALAMMKQIVLSKQTSTTTSASIISTVVMLVILFSIATIIVLAIKRKNKLANEIKSGKRKPRRRHAQHL